MGKKHMQTRMLSLLLPMIGHPDVRMSSSESVDKSMVCEAIHSPFHNHCVACVFQRPVKFISTCFLKITYIGYRHTRGTNPFSKCVTKARSNSALEGSTSKGKEFFEWVAVSFSLVLSSTRGPSERHEVIARELYFVIGTMSVRE